MQGQQGQVHVHEPLSTSPVATAVADSGGEYAAAIGAVPRSLPEWRAIDTLDAARAAALPYLSRRRADAEDEPALALEALPAPSAAAETSAAAQSRESAVETAQPRQAPLACAYEQLWQPWALHRVRAWLSEAAAALAALGRGAPCRPPERLVIVRAARLAHAACAAGLGA